MSLETTSAKTLNESILVIDYLHAGSAPAMSFELFSNDRSTPPALKLFFGPEKRARASLLRCKLSATPAVAVETFLRSFASLGITARTQVVFGRAVDPLTTDGKLLDGTLRAIELLAGAGFTDIRLQTRSPLVLLLSPVMRALGNRAKTTMAIESVDDELAARLTPQLPKPSERIAALEAMASAGMSTEFQAAPLVCRGSSQASLTEFAELALRTPCAVRVINTSRIFSPQGDATCATEKRLARMVRADGHRLLRNETIRLQQTTEDSSDNAREPKAA